MSQELSKFKKNNKQRREIIAKKLGFNSAEEYIKTAFPEDKPIFSVSRNKVKKNTNKNYKIHTFPTIHNVYILDASGSMRGEKFKNAISGINIEIEELKKVKNISYKQTIISFSGNNDIVVKYLATPINEVKEYKDRARDTTALLDAIGYTFSRIKTVKDPKDKVLVKIFTDGEDNSSISESWSSISKKIKNLEKEGYTITFVGTEHDTKEVVERLKIDKSNTLIHDNTGQGVLDAFTISTIATTNYSSKVLKGQDVTKGFYKKVGKL